MAERRFIAKSLFMLAGLLIWAAHFAVIYAFNALACARGFAASMLFGLSVVPLGIAFATVVALAATLWVLVQAARWQAPISGERADASSAFIRYTAIAVGLLSLVAIAWNGLPALIVPPCG